MTTQTGKFDLNMEEVLEAWGPADATREILANALDEQALTSGADPEVSQDEEGRWHIRDHGRGLRYEHLTQSEDDVKLANPDTVIGKFGVGLKDALATFHRHGTKSQSTLHTIRLQSKGHRSTASRKSLPSTSPLNTPRKLSKEQMSC